MRRRSAVTGWPIVGVGRGWRLVLQALLLGVVLSLVPEKGSGYDLEQLPVPGLMRERLIVGGVLGLLALWLWSLRRQVRRKTEELRSSETLLGSLAGNIPGAVYRCGADLDGPVDYISARVEDLCGYPAADFMAPGQQSLGAIIHPDDRRATVENVQTALSERRVFAQEYRLLQRDGSCRWVVDRGQGVFDAEGHLLHIDGVVIDISERKRMEETLRRHSETDPSTGLYNRRFGQALLGKLMRLAARQEVPLSVCFIDLDDLKRINDLYGHKEGDHCILTVVKLFKAAIRESDVLCRHGGDEFLLILPDTDRAEAEMLWERLVTRLAEANAEGGRPYALRASHGIAEFGPDTTMGPDELVALADLEMYREKSAKKAGLSHAPSDGEGRGGHVG